MMKNWIAAACFFSLIGMYAIAQVGPPAPDAFWVDDELYRTVATPSMLPDKGPKDGLYVFEGLSGQTPVAEAKPGDQDYNGGRWETWTATWTDDVPHQIPVLKSEASILAHVELGHLTIEQGSPGGPPPYFSCPLLPVK